MFGLGLIEMLIMLAIPILVIGGIVRVASGGRGRRQVGSGSDLAALEERTARLEESLANMQDQMARLAENQEFTTKLLSDRK